MKRTEVPFDPANPFAPESTVYTFVEDNGTNVNIASGLLRNWCVANKTKLNVTKVPVYPELFFIFLEQNSVNFARIESLTPMELSEPIIMCRRKSFGPASTLLVDGHHRYSVAVLTRKKTIAAWELTLDQWSPFVIDDLPTLSQEQLTALPPKPRA